MNSLETAKVSTASNTKRQFWIAMKWLALVYGGLILVLLLASPYLYALHDVTVSQSPDGLHKIIVRQPRFVFIDRNFRVILIDTRSGAHREIFRSFDQDPTIKQERFVWSADSNRVGLLGDDYFVVPNSQLPSGEIVFLVYNLDNGDFWCNTDHNRGFNRISPQAAAKMLGL